MAAMNRRNILLKVAALGVAGAVPAFAEDAAPSAYNIELIVFRITGGSGTPENWAAEASSNGEGAVAGAESGSGGARELGRFITALPASAYQLGGIETKLRSSGGYVPVAHAAWSQTASTWGTRGGFPVTRLGIDVPGLSGSVFLERGQFLHLGVALSYAVPNPPAGLQAAPGTVFTINESRRVKFYESTYFDHPAFGVIAMVAPAQGKRPPGR
jgi:hypothetical protein